MHVRAAITTRRGVHARHHHHRRRTTTPHSPDPSPSRLFLPSWRAPFSSLASAATSARVSSHAHAPPPRSVRSRCSYATRRALLYICRPGRGQSSSQSPTSPRAPRRRREAAAASSNRRPPRTKRAMERRRRQRGRGGAGGGRRPSRAALRRKVRQLRRLVPGGEDAPAGSLFVRAADYIARLRAQVELLRALTALCAAATPPAQLPADVEVCVMD